MKPFFIFLAVILGVGVLLYWLLVGSPAKKPSEQSVPKPINPNSGQPSGVEDAPAPPTTLGFNSTKVASTDVTPALNPNGLFINANESNMASYNILTYPVLGKGFIHYDTKFSASCPLYVWHNKSYYSLLGANTDESGVKTCYYKLDRNILPQQLKIQSLTPPYSCTGFKYYVSGVEYVFNKAVAEGAGVSGTKHYCLYNKKS